MKDYIIVTVLGFALGVSVMFAEYAPEANADRPDRQSCECLELKRIRNLLEQQFNVICDESHCIPAPTPTAPNGGELP